jgi:FKBP-type peptidyl-prolyl cis-trans isomerase FkpA
MKKYIFKIAVAIAVIPFVLTSCLDSDYTPPDYNAKLTENLALVNQTKLASDKEVIDDSLALWGVTGVQIEPRAGVRYTIQELGTGPKPLLESVIVVKYKAKFLKDGPNGVPFDDNDELQINLFSLILGWQTTLPLIPQGSKVTLYVPSGLAYGPEDIRNNNGDIVVPKDSNLVFEVELLGVY